MNPVVVFLGAIWTGVAAVAAKVGLQAGALAFLGPLAPIVSGIGQFIGAVVTAIAEIVASLSKSAEGRIALALLVATCGLLYLRFHYIQEGRALERAHIAAVQKPCPVAKGERRTR